MNPQGPHRILVVEDEEAIQFVVTQHLEFGGYAVSVAANGREGLALARQNKPHLIVSDVSMPIMDGFEMLKAIRADEQLRHIPVIFHSVLVEPRYAQQAKKLGSAYFLNKPCRANDMLAAVQDRLRAPASSGM